jgi:hypothetical protein
VENGKLNTPSNIDMAIALTKAAIVILENEVLLVDSPIQNFANEIRIAFKGYELALQQRDHKQDMENKYLNQLMSYYEQ